VELLVEIQPAERAGGRIIGWLGDDLDVEGASCVIGHDSLFLRLDIRSLGPKCHGVDDGGAIAPE